MRAGIRWEGHGKNVFLLLLYLTGRRLARDGQLTPQQGLKNGDVVGNVIFKLLRAQTLTG